MRVGGTTQKLLKRSWVALSGRVLSGCVYSSSIVSMERQMYASFPAISYTDFCYRILMLRLGFLPPFCLSASLAHLVTPLLFLGPLFGSYLRGELSFQRNWMWETHVVARYLSVHGLRNYWFVNNLIFLSSISLML